MRTIYLLGPAVGFLALGAYACGDSSTAAPATDYTAVLNNVSQSVVIPANTDFATQADAFAAAATALDATPTAATFAAAQTAWRAARLAWRKLDAVHFGPVADLQLTGRIDVSPAVPSDVDTIVNGTTTIDLAAVGAHGGKTKGFLGSQYLLFAKPLADLTGDGAAARRRALVHYQAAEIAATAHQLADAWTGSGGYANIFVTAGNGSSRYVSQRAAIDDVVGGVAFAIEIVVGQRLARPLGRKSTGTPDPSQDYTSASDSTQADIKGSLDGVNAVYAGQGLSVRVKTSSTALDTKWTRDIGDCASKVAGLSTPFDTIVVSATTTVQTAYDACKTAKATWNTDVTTALGATLRPSENDGD